MKYLIAVLCLALAALAVAEPSPKGLEIPITFADASTPYEIRTAIRAVGGDWIPATYCKLAASDSVRVQVVSPTEDEGYYAPGEWINVLDNEVNGFLRFTPGGQPLDWDSPTKYIRVYGQPGAPITVNLWCEY